jgi:HAD superfamily hydrolase (TIGR01509 family)
LIPEFPVYLFDVDGTLLDSAADICGAIQEVLSTTPCKDTPDSFLRRYIGRHLYDLFDDLFPGIGPAEREVMMLDYRRIYPARNHTMTRAYPGVHSALAGLGGRKSTATTKGTPTTRVVLEMFGLLPYFQHVQGTDGFPAKPAPNVIFASLEVFGAKPEECLFVGDSAADMEAGRRAGVNTCAVLYGYGQREDLAKWEPDYWVTDLRELCLSHDRNASAIPVQ